MFLKANAFEIPGDDIKYEGGGSKKYARKGEIRLV